jgi:HlyD family secretion protein
LAQVDNAKATLKNAQISSPSRNILRDRSEIDQPRRARQCPQRRKIAATNLEVVSKQYELTKAGAWSYDIENQERQYTALEGLHSGAALLGQIHDQSPGGRHRALDPGRRRQLRLVAGAYDSYTQGMDPLIVMGAPDDHLQVRAYIDEILIDRLADPAKLSAEMFIRGTDKHVSLTFVRTQPYVSPKIELSDERQELVDVRVLPVIFRFANPKSLNVYPGELVDVYVSAK